LTLFYIGDIKYAPGTFASFVVLCVWFFIPNIFFLQIQIILFVSFFGFLLSYLYMRNMPIKDPQYIVIDEAVGMMISLFLIPKTIFIYMLAFFLFRFFDILKPSIIDRIQKFENGIGIMADDILAGILTVLIINGIFQL